MENEKKCLETGMMCTMDGTSFHLLTKNTWIGNSGATCHITNDENGMYDITEINESIQGNSGIMPATKPASSCEDERFQAMMPTILS